MDACQINALFLLIASSILYFSFVFFGARRDRKSVV